MKRLDARLNLHLVIGGAAEARCLIGRLKPMAVRAFGDEDDPDPATSRPRERRAVDLDVQITLIQILHAATIGPDLAEPIWKPAWKRGAANVRERWGSSQLDYACWGHGEFVAPFTR